VLPSAVVGLGHLPGSASIAPFRPGLVAVLFAGKAIGTLDPRFAPAGSIYVIGLVLLVYAVGLQSGPGFFASFRKRGLRINALVVLLLAGGAALAAALSRPLALPLGVVSGMQTRPACLAYANQRTPSERPNVCHAAVYPASMVTKTVLAQLLVSLLPG